MHARCVAEQTILGIFLILSPLHVANAELLINEVLYDPDGPDAGNEFVEITNTGPFAVTLEGLTLEAGNGARPDDWDLQWSGPANVALPPGGFYRIGLDRPGVGESVELSLQNGPDGVRLSKQGFELDRVGWGELIHQEYFESHPAFEVRAGQSLARHDDGVDTDDNRADFVSSAPTPGRPNSPHTDWAIRFGQPTPEVPRPGEVIVVRLVATNRGKEEASPPAVEADGCGPPLLIGWNASVPPGGSVGQFVQLMATDIGRMTERARFLRHDEVPENDSDSIRVRVGVGPVRIVEILAAPDPDGCEWIELRADVPDGTVLTDLTIDVRGKRLLLAPWTVDSLTRIGLIVEDSLLMRRRYPEVDPSALLAYEGGWPRLRNGQKDGGVSDTIRLRAPDGCVAEVAMPGTAPALGVSLQRLDADLPEGPAAWIPCVDPSGATPGREAAIRGVGAAGEPLRITPRVLRPGSSTCVIEGSVGSAPGEVRLELLDLRGSTVRCLMRDTWVAGHLAATWDGRDESGQIVAPGIYVAVLEIDRPSGSPERWRTAIAVTPQEGP